MSSLAKPLYAILFFSLLILSSAQFISFNGILFGENVKSLEGLQRSNEIIILNQEFAEDINSTTESSTSIFGVKGIIGSIKRFDSVVDQSSGVIGDISNQLGLPEEITIWFALILTISILLLILSAFVRWRLTD